ncbi:hypothetical protein Plhal304r1_c054g0139371 [Plasmopara halstedii]
MHDGSTRCVSYTVGRWKHKHLLPVNIVSESDPRFVAEFRQALLTMLGTRSDICMTDHPEIIYRPDHVIRADLKHFLP